ncbi:ribonuclease [Saccharopolyspora indica]|uniref:Ribonuclease T1 n=2 Tax=Saccharopolyspora TaxID=1835 RepID=A0A1I4T6Z5_9PSEU|nr:MULTISPECIES: ribonuclease [Saccharopolyspora]MDA3643452.1 ribonuclease [Saccharopolyspora indica]RKT85839.1 ribonuclease T1 [Saccharopolyspora antimicrobica]SEG62301.1 ribonuclease T1 [Saccharopolyspora kobensis]SFE84841.1 ribonuclease T1 [Saccharopolyspora kobensis]SFM72401.1 ribonuclease T1 [Saccharopolyspora antimicrobica]
MMRITSKTVQLLLVGLLAVAGLVGFQTSAVSAPVAVQAPCGDTSEFQKVNLSELPPEATDTVNLIKKGGPYPYPQDGTVFQNREGILPDCETGYYREYTVETPGSDDRGARRFVVGEAGEYFYTEDHYESFKLTNVDA